MITEEAVKLAEELNEESFNMMKGNADKLKKIAPFPYPDSGWLLLYKIPVISARV